MRTSPTRLLPLLWTLTLLTPLASTALAVKEPAPAKRYLQAVLEGLDQVEARIPEMTKVAELVAARHLAGGMLSVIWDPPAAAGPQGPQYEIRGRSGGMMAFDTMLKTGLASASRDKDTAIIGWQRAPGPYDLEVLKKYHEKYFVVAFGPRGMKELAPLVRHTDAWIDTGMGQDDRTVTFPSGVKGGRINAFLNAANCWAFLGEVIAATTRQGKMPTMLLTHVAAESKEWNERYRKTTGFHDDMKIAPVAPGTLSRRYLDGIRGLVRQFNETQSEQVAKAGALIAEELAQGRKTYVAQCGHTTYEHVGRYEDQVWAVPMTLHNSAGRRKGWIKETPDGALVLRVGYSGEHVELRELYKEKKQRLLLIAASKNARPGEEIPKDLPNFIEMGWDANDAVVNVEGYPIRIFPSSGVMQLVAYEAVNVEAMSRVVQAAVAEEGKWPPAMLGAQNGTATVTSTAFLRIPEAVQKGRTQEGAAAFSMARTPPTVEVAYHADLPDRALNGTGWTVWGDIGVADDGRVYSGIGNHGKNPERPANGGGNAFIYCWDPATKALKQIADLNKVNGSGEGDPTWSKVHAGVYPGGDGAIYSTGTLNSGGTAFKIKWTERVPGGQLFRYDPKTGQTKIITTFPGEVTPTTLIDRERNIWYANMEGKTSGKDVALTAVDLNTGKVIFQSPHTAVVASRNIALARDGSVIFNGEGGFWKYNPTSKSIAATKSSLPPGTSMRSSTHESKAGFIYGTTMRPAQLFRYAPAADKLELLGPDFLNGNYTTVTVLSPDDKYVYYLPGAHGGAALIGTPVLQYNVATGKQKVIAFLKEGIEKATGYSPAGTYGVKISADGGTLYVNFNGNLAADPNPPKRQAKGFGLTAFAAIHIPETERTGR